MADTATASTASIASLKDPNPSEYKEEPVSGKMGDVAKGEPYDAGNLEPAASQGTSTDEVKKESSTVEDDTPAKNPTTEKPELDGTNGEENKDHAESAPAPATDGNAVQPTSKETDDSAVKESSASVGDQSKTQSDIRDPSEPQTEPSKEVRENVDNTTGGPDMDDNPVKLEGPGPKPLEQLAKENGGAVGSGKSSGESGAPGEGAGGDDEDGPQKESTGEGTGEKYIKTTGLQADGGNFDASQAGAGREADRLLEEKGVKHGDTPADHSVDVAEKTGPIAKIKEKLHVGKS